MGEVVRRKQSSRFEAPSLISLLLNVELEFVCLSG